MSDGGAGGSPPAAQATILFNGGDFDGAIGVLERVARKDNRSRDPRLAQNIAISRFAKSECRDAAQLLAELTALAGNARRPDGDESKVAPAIDDTVDRSVVRYNLAVAMYNLRQFAAAQRVLETLLGDVLTPVDEEVAMRATFLLLDVYAAGFRGAVRADQDVSAIREKAQQAITELEKPHRFNGLLDAAGAPVSDSRSKDVLSHVADFRFRLHLAKARMELLMGNHKVCKKEVKSALEIYQKDLSGGDATRAFSKSGAFLGEAEEKNTAALLVKAQLEYLRKNHSKSLRLLSSCHAGGGLPPVVYLNNIGCIYSKLKRDQAAALHFARALEASNESPRGQFYATAEGSALTIRPPPASCEVLYNCGLALLRLGKGPAALKSFQRAALLFRHRPRLWLRMAEACIVEHERGRKAQRAARDVASTSWAAAGVVTGVAGDGRLRRLRLATSGDAIPPPDAAAARGDVSCSLEYAVECLHNCLALLEDDMSDADVEAAAAAGAGRPAAPATATPGSALRQAALCKLAYVNLALGDPVSALNSAQQLLALPDCREPWRYRCRLYASEALCRLSMAAGVERHLTQTVLVQVTTPPAADSPSAPINEGSLSPQDATAAFFVNLASMYLLRDNLPAALQCARQALVASPSSVEARRLSVYLSLRCGAQRDALALLKLGQIPEAGPTARAAGSGGAGGAGAGAGDA